jgi:hypothetical protein
VPNTQGLNSPSEVYFFSKNPEQYTLASRNYDYEIGRASEQTLDSAKVETLSSAKFQVIPFAAPTVDVQGKKYVYVVRSYASRDQFQKVMSPEHSRTARGVGIPGLHYSAVETYGDAIGITVEADTPQVAKEQFQAWYAAIKKALNTVADRFAILNRDIEQKIAELTAERRDELDRAKNALQ